MTCDALPELPDAKLLSLATAPFDKRTEMDHRKVLGRHRGRCVVADFPCSDVCPDNTTRIVHYVPDDLASCTQTGGMVVTRYVPRDVGRSEQQFCEPEIVANYQPPVTHELDLKQGVSLGP